MVAGGRPRKVDIRLPEKGNSNSHGARPVHFIISMIKWIRTSRLSIKNSLSAIARLQEQEDQHQAGLRPDCEALGQLGQDEPASG